jgi:acyl-CoA synthetase (NDP forming)
LASDTRIVRAVLSAHGATVVEDVDQLFCAAELLATERTAGSRLGGATISGGHVGLLLDSAEKEGLSFPNLTLSASSAVQRALGEPRQVCNPVDCWVDGRVVESVRDAVAAMATDASLGGFVLALDAPRDPPTSDPGLPIDIASAVAVIAEEDDRPWVVVSTAISADDPSLAEVLSRRGIPRLSGLAQAFKAWSAVARTTRDPVPERVDKTWSGPIPTTDAEAFRLVAGWGISSATFSECRTLSEACRDAARIGYPVVLKVVQPGLLHKSDSGGVRLGITNEAELTVAYGEIKRAHPAMDAVLVAEQVADGLDVFVGAYMDREFGPVVLFGPGGILVELVDETTVIAAPTTAKVIDQKLNGTRLESLLGGYRGREPGSREALCQAVARVSILIASSGRKGVSIDINPLRVTLEGAIALDVKVEGVASDG